LEAVVDWGAAQDYVRAMWLMLQQEHPEDYVVANGVGRTVKDFAQQAFSSVGMPYELTVFQDPAGDSSASVPMVGNSSKLKRHTGWMPEVSFDSMAASMVAAQQFALEQDKPT
jgi:GDPmannose 4,6-dehydratase